MPKDTSEPVVAFMPARNEESVIEASVKSVLPQVERLIVIDDASTDATGAKLRALVDPRLQVIVGQGPGAGECGKPAALAKAVERVQPQSEWLLFVDADVVLEPGAVGALLELGKEQDLVSVVPQVHLHTFAEHAVMPTVGSVVLASHRDRPFANGQVILIRRKLYEAAGGHRAVIDQVLEDVRLAERVASIGGRLLLADGRRIASTRMYESWSELSEGWIKNLHLLLGRSTWKWVFYTVVLGWSGPVVGLWAGWPHGVIAYLGIFAVQAALRSLGGAPWIGALLAPLGATGAAYLMLASRFRHASGKGVAWKGRSIKGGGA
jgi:glycosyltransferase involved in cell wall biosynthesis